MITKAYPKGLCLPLSHGRGRATGKVPALRVQTRQWVCLVCVLAAVINKVRLTGLSLLHFTSSPFSAGAGIPLPHRGAGHLCPEMVTQEGEGERIMRCFGPWRPFLLVW